MYESDFMSYAGYRSMQIDQKINEAVSAILAGSKNVVIDCEDLDLSDDEMQYVNNEIARRIQAAKLNGKG